MSSIHRWLFPVAAALALAAPLSAQWKPVAGADQARTVPSTLTSAPAPHFGFVSGVESIELEPTTPTFSAPAFPGQARESENVALMIVGGAALVVGSVIGGDAGTLMMVGGGVAGLVGLYRYLR
ncbi:MAG: hypothetical protein ABL963_04530 [Longimicrobiales bacterium]